jgi:hypothetical protein
MDITAVYLFRCRIISLKGKEGRKGDRQTELG